MKAEIWYKSNRGIVEKISEYEKEFLSTEPPGIQSKNGYHLVVTETYLPKPSVPSPKLPVFPNTLLGVRNCPTMRGIAHLGKVASLLPGAGYVESSVYPSLLRRLASLAEAYDMLRQDLLKIPSDTLQQLEDQVSGKK